MNVHEIYAKFSDKREMLFKIHLDLVEEANFNRSQRDFISSMIKFIDMKNALDSPDGIWQAVNDRLDTETDRRLALIDKLKQM